MDRSFPAVTCELVGVGDVHFSAPLDGPHRDVGVSLMHRHPDGTTYLMRPVAPFEFDRYEGMDATGSTFMCQRCGARFHVALTRGEDLPAIQRTADAILREAEGKS